MGKHAEDMLYGDACQQCGGWVGSGEGHPQTCSNCSDIYDKEAEELRRFQYCLKLIEEIDPNAEAVANEKCIYFTWKGALCKHYPYSGWHTGKTIRDGRGIKKLMNQLK